MSEVQNGILQTVEVDPLEAAVIAAAVAGDLVVVVDSLLDFGEDGGDVVINGVSYSYDTALWDESTAQGTITLSRGLEADVAIDTPVALLTSEGELAEDWTAMVELDESMPPIEVDIPVEKRRGWQTGDEQAGALVAFTDNGAGGYEVTGVPGRAVTETEWNLVGALAHIAGRVVLDNGVDAPTFPPSAGTSWTHGAAYTECAAANTAGAVRGLYDNGTEWIIGRSNVDGYVEKVDKTTGDVTALAGPFTGRQPFGGVTKVGTDWYVLVFKNSDATYWVRKYNSSWVFQSEWQFTPADTGGMGPTIGTDGTHLIIARMASPTSGPGGRLIIRQYNTDGTGVTTLANTTVTTWPREALSGIYVGSADFGATRYVASTLSGSASSKVLVLNSSGVEQTGQEWTPADNDPILGFSWDGTRFHSISAGQVWHYSTRVTSALRVLTSTFYDSDSGGLGTHETTASPSVSAYQFPRQWLLIETDPSSGFDGDVDSPDSVRIYVDNHRQPDLGVGVFSAVYDAPDLASAGAPTVNGFIGVSSPGELSSGASDVLGPLIDFLGSGAGRTGDRAWDVTGKTTAWPWVPRARAGMTAPFSLATSGTVYTLDLNTEAAPGYDNDSLHSTTVNPSRILLNRIGAWIVTARGGFAANATGRRLVMIYLNGVEVARNIAFPNASTIAGVSVTETIQATAVTDYVEVRVLQQSGGALNTVEDYCSLSVAYLGK